MPNHPQLKSRGETQERELKEQLSSIQEEAKKQLQAITVELHAKSGQLAEKEKELGEVKGRMEAEVQRLTERLESSKMELERTQGVLTQVCAHGCMFVRMCGLPFNVQYTYMCT